ncbi:MAG: hypothetical protein KDA91_08440 [Planctomycetaceae bacterium]|nr:hypothetical protein [Planctomycetaceae bacterium]
MKVATSGTLHSGCRLFLAMAAGTICVLSLQSTASAAPADLRVATFDIDVTPPPGYRMAYDPVVRVDELTLRCRGIVLQGDSKPVVLCAVDWIGIANESHDAFRESLARAAGTTFDRVAVHTLHQHDAPVTDFTNESILRDAGATDTGQYDSAFTRQVLQRLEAAVSEAVTKDVAVTHVGFGVADVKEVASNRRILGPDGKVAITRYTATRDPKVRAEPEGTIDPQVSVISFWQDKNPVAVLSYYACHPQSYYRMGIPSPDFPGIARFVRQQAVPSAVHVHFNGAGGNIGAGKYNDGSHSNRVKLAMKLADGMQRAFDNTLKIDADSAPLSWHIRQVSLPPAKHLEETRLRTTISANPNSAEARVAGDKLAWLSRCRNGHKIDIPMLSLGDIRILHMPGELFVEYQLAAKAARPDLNVAMAAYGDYGPGYIGTEIAYSQGGYEASERASDVAPDVEAVLMTAIQELLKE